MNCFNESVSDREPLISHRVGLILSSAVRVLERQIHQFCEE